MKATFISRFTPSLMKPEALEAIFVQREKLANRIIELISDSAVTLAKHHTLLISPRGIGKTHLVALASVLSITSQAATTASMSSSHNSSHLTRLMNLSNRSCGC